MKFNHFYYGSCLLLAGLIIGVVVGLAISGATAEYPMSNTAIFVMTIAFIIGIFIDWKDRINKGE